METIKTNGFTNKDMFNTSSSTPLKDIKGVHVNVVDVFVETKIDGSVVAYLKTDDGQIYGTISTSVIDQVVKLANLLPATVVVVPKTSNAGREYLMLELV